MDFAGVVESVSEQPQVKQSGVVAYIQDARKLAEQALTMCHDLGRGLSRASLKDLSHVPNLKPSFINLAAIKPGKPIDPEALFNSVTASAPSFL